MKQYYKDNDEIDKYTKTVGYTNAPICFGLGWNTFDMETNSFDIDIRTGMSEAVPTATDQVIN